MNSKTGAVTLTASDVGAGTYSKPSGGIPKTDLASAVQTSLGKADTALQSAPVSSVNSKTGAVVLDAGDLSYDGTETYSSGTVGKEISNVKGDLNNNGITNDLREALLQLAAHVAYIDDDGQDYYNDLEDALMTNKWKITNTLSNCVSSNSSKFVDKGSSYSATISASTGYILIGATVSVTMGGTDITSSAYSNGSITIASVTGNVVITVTAVAKAVSSISAVYTQSGTVYTTDSLDSLKSDLVVTATYNDSTTATVLSTDYTLSGTLTAGTSTVTVTYEGKTTTFTVTVTEAGKQPIYNWDLTNSLTDSVGGITATTNATQDSSGVSFTAGNQYVNFRSIYASDRTYELDVVNHTQKGHGGTGEYGRLFMCDEDTNTAAGGAGFIFVGSKRSGCGYQFYSGTGWDNTSLSNIPAGSNSNDYNDAFFDGKTIKFYISSSNTLTVSYKTIGADDSTYITLGTSNALKTYTTPLLIIGSSGNGDFLYNTTISALRVYEGQV